MNILIRGMISGDVVAVSKVMRACNEFLAEQEGYSSCQRERMIADRCSEEWVRQTTAQSETYVAESDGRILGLIGLEGNEIAELWVDLGSHRRGIGTRLFSEAERILRSRGHAVLTVHTTGYAVPFYQAMGAHVVGSKPCDSGPLHGWMLTYLEKELKT